MNRTLTTSMKAAVNASTVRPAFLYEGEFEGGTLRLWTGQHTLVMSGNEWTGAGQLLSMAPVSETLDVRADGLSLSLSGMPSSLVSTMLANARYGKPGKLYFACLTNSGTVIDDPYLTFRGRFDQPEIDDTGDTCTITVRYENALIDLHRARRRNYTKDDQEIDFPGDKGFDFVPSLQDKSFPWGTPPPAPIQQSSISEEGGSAGSSTPTKNREEGSNDD